MIPVKGYSSTKSSLYAGDTSSHVTLGTCMAYIYKLLLILMHSCADIWRTKISNQIFVFTHYQCIYEALTLCSCLLSTQACFAIDYHVNKDTPFLLVRPLQPSKYYNTSVL